MTTDDAHSELLFPEPRVLLRLWGDGPRCFDWGDGLGWHLFRLVRRYLDESEFALDLYDSVGDAIRAEGKNAWLVVGGLRLPELDYFDVLCAVVEGNAGVAVIL